MLTGFHDNKGDEINVVDLIKNYDWSSTCLGSMDSWEPSLRTALASDLSLIIINLRLKATRKGIIHNDLALQSAHDELEHYTSFFTSPIYKEDGSLWAMSIVNFTTTHEVLLNRRLKILGDLRNRINVLYENNKDINFALFYRVDNKKLSSGFRPCSARLTASTFNNNICDSISDKLLETSEIIDLSKNEDENYNEYIEIKKAMISHLFLKCKSWPIHLVIKQDMHIKVLLKDGSQAVLFPVKSPYEGYQSLLAVLICGINPCYPLDEKYMEFLQLIVNHVSLTLTRCILRKEEEEHIKMLDDLNRQKVMFFQNVGHELLTPLTLILLPLDEAINSCMQETIIHLHLQTIQRNTYRLLKLVNNLHQFSIVESGQLEPHYCETDIAKFTSELAANFNEIAKKLNLDYIIDIPNPDEFKKALGNKVYLDHDITCTVKGSNAFKNTWNGQICVCLYIEQEDERNTIILEVSDTGVGISESDIPKLFQRFQRVGSQRSRSYEGSGVGLALVKELVKYHGGNITATSKLGRGTTFKCRFLTGFEHLPRKNVYINKKVDELNQEQKLYTKKQLYLEENLQWSQSNEPTTKKELLIPESIDDRSVIAKTVKHKVLLVEDNLDMKNYLEELLRKEFEVYCAYDGYDAMMLLAKLPKQPDLILSDIMMPNMDGYTLLNKLRSNPTTQLIPVILLTARADEFSGLDYGANDYIVKPFSSRELIARINTNIEISQLRCQLISLHCKQEEVKQLLISISSNILSGLDLKEMLPKTVEDIHQLLPCDSVFVISDNPFELKSRTIIAVSDYCGLVYLTPKNSNMQQTMTNQQKFSNYNDKEFKVEVLPNTYCFDFGKQVSMISAKIKVNNGDLMWIKAHRAPNSTWLDSEIDLFQQISNQMNLMFNYKSSLDDIFVREVQIEAIKAANNVKSLILANVSHELRTPLGAIIGITSSFENELSTIQQKEMAKILLNVSDSVLSMVNNFLNEAKLEKHKNTSITFNLLDLFEDTIELFSEGVGNKQVELILNYESDTLPRYVKSEPERIKFTKEGEIILQVSLKTQSISYEKFGSEIAKKATLLVELSDTGIGSEFINNIWKGNFNVNGTGFGLMTCKKLVDINGGEIGVESQLGKGSKFWFAWNVEITPAGQSSLERSYNLLNTLVDEPINRVLLIYPSKNARNAIVNYFKHSISVDLYDTYDQGIKAAKYYKATYNQTPYGTIFIDLYEINEDEILKAALELREINGDNSLIIFIAFSNTNRRTLVKKLINKISGK
ncbi:6677_t:CDS:10, partial [Scutellospora calospora]